MSDYDPDERFTLDPLEGEDVLRKLLGAEDGDEGEPAEDDES